MWAGLKELHPKCLAGDNRDRFAGGFRLWKEVNKPQLMPPTHVRMTLNTEVRKGK
jgi:hypothetical protein